MIRSRHSHTVEVDVEGDGGIHSWQVHSFNHKHRVDEARLGHDHDLSNRSGDARYPHNQPEQPTTADGFPGGR